MFDEDKASIELNAENILITDGGVLQVSTYHICKILTLLLFLIYQ